MTSNAHIEANKYLPKSDHKLSLVDKIRRLGEDKEGWRDAHAEAFVEWESIARDLLNEFRHLWWAFDSKDKRADMLLKIADEFESRIAACACGTPEPHQTDNLYDREEASGKE